KEISIVVEKRLVKINETEEKKERDQKKNMDLSENAEWHLDCPDPTEQLIQYVEPLILFKKNQVKIRTNEGLKGQLK
ncbi:11257_t:CDS:2, partial [Acaulospora morrowiae]